MPPVKQINPEVTDGRKRRAKKGSIKLSQMTIDQYIAAVEEWQKQGEALRTEGQRFQAALNNVGFGIKVPLPSQPMFYQQPQPQPQPQPTKQSVATGGGGEEWETPQVSMIDPAAQQSELQDSISQQLNQANMLLQQTSDPF